MSCQKDICGRSYLYCGKMVSSIPLLLYSTKGVLVPLSGPWIFSVTDLNFWEHERANFPLAGSDTTTARRLITTLTEIYRSQRAEKDILVEKG
jgi:hypothetical protein